MAHDVFISYSSKDRNVADAICSALENQKIRCWIAHRDVTPGKEWGEEIVQAISSSKVMVLVFSSAADRSQQVLREVERAVNKKVVIVPFRIENVVPTKSMEYFLYSTHWLDALTPDLENHIARLNEIVNALMNAEKLPAKKVKPVGKGSKLKPRSPVFWMATGMFLTLGVIGILGLVNNKLSSPAVTQVIEPIPSTQENANPVHEAKQTDQGALDQPENTIKKIHFKIGDYVRFGRFNGQSINWRVVHVSTQGNPILLADKIVSLKPFDAPESGVVYHTVDDKPYDSSGSFTVQEMREMIGNNEWVRSNIREWLNSSDKLVKYTTQPPIWSDPKEPGFLYDFTSQERDLLASVTYKTVLPEADQDTKEGGTEVFNSDVGEVYEAIPSYDQAYYQNVTDKVFLLSIKEVKEYLWDQGWDIRAGITPEAVLRDKRKDLKDNLKYTEGYWSYWLRTPIAKLPHEVFEVDYYGKLSPCQVHNEQVGVRPALMLARSEFSPKGSGKEDDPYVMEF
jgi:hypothetical protein